MYFFFTGAEKCLKLIQAEKIASVYSPILKENCVITNHLETRVAALKENLPCFWIPPNCLSNQPTVAILKYFLLANNRSLPHFIPGVDFGGTYTKIGFMPQGQPEEKSHLRLILPRTFANSSEEEILSFLKKLCIPPFSYKIGISLACTMDAVKNESDSANSKNPTGFERRISKESSKFGKTLGYIEGGFIHKLEQKWNSLGVAVSLINDGEAASIAEHRQGAGKNYHHCLVITLGTSIGVGFIIAGKLLQGPYSSRASHLILDTQGDWCSKGHRGCWKTLVGREAFYRLAENMRLPGDSFLIAEKARAGDKGAIRCYEVYADGVARGIANIVNAIPLEAVIIGGGLAKAVDVFFPILMERINKGDLIEKTLLSVLNIHPAECEESALLGAQLYAEEM